MSINIYVIIICLNFFGILCSNIFCVISNEHIESIPPSLICNWWRKNVNSNVIFAVEVDEMDAEIVSSAHFVVLVFACNTLCHLASERFDFFNELR